MIKKTILKNGVKTKLPVNVGINDTLLISTKLSLNPDLIYAGTPEVTDSDIKPLNERDVINAMKAINEEEIAESKFWDMVNVRCHDEQ